MARLYKRGKVFYSDILINGSRVRRPLSTDKRAAQAKLADLIRSRDSGKYGHIYREITWDEFVDRYLTHAKASKVKNTYNTDARALNLMRDKAIERLPPLDL